MNGSYLPIQGYQGKSHYYARPSYHGRHTLMQVQATQGSALLLNPSYHEMMWPHKVMLSCKLSIMMIQATLEGYDFSIQGYPRVLLSQNTMHGLVLPSQAIDEGISHHYFKLT
ncbi:hypothetical protein H5410_014865 [Solanum commersonii]|uniref:Uncharacterized protein n=1 Tax=Solanum commersonii TaxID=4109 RepID=A0A9J5ZS50_SOLCO|nr:hypothetical protein H5410_014865 [Solanum commersonii]